MKNLEKFTARQLTSKHGQLMDDIEQLPPGTEIDLKTLRKKLAFEKELQRRLYSLMIGDVLPVISTAIKPLKEKVEIVFNFDVISGLNTLIDRFKINATTKDAAWKKAEEKAETYSGQVSLKIS